ADLDLLRFDRAARAALVDVLGPLEVYQYEETVFRRVLIIPPLSPIGICVRALAPKSVVNRSRCTEECIQPVIVACLTGSLLLFIAHLAYGRSRLVKLRPDGVDCHVRLLIPLLILLATYLEPYSISS